VNKVEYLKQEIETVFCRYIVHLPTADFIDENYTNLFRTALCVELHTKKLCYKQIL